MSERILLIEDNEANLDLMEYLLHSFGYRTLIARDGAEGLALLRRELPDLVVCDIELPVLDGSEVAREVKAGARTSSIPLVAVTAFAMAGDSDRILAAGFDGYIPKPINPQTFVQEIEGFLPDRPRMPVAVPERLTDSTPLACGKGVRLLVVDNAELNLTLQRSIFEPLGYEVFTAHETSQGIELARRHLPHLIISDLNMENGSGFDFIEAVKQDASLRSIPFVFVTSTTRSEAARARGIALGAARFLFRPIEPRALIAEIESCLRSAEN